jgi:hypothetical protein
MRLPDIADAAIETFEHGVGLRGSRFAQAMLDAQDLAQRVERMRAGRLTRTGDR